MPCRGRSAMVRTDVRTHLASLLGQTSLDGNASERHRVLRVAEDGMLVGTEQSPGAVPLEWVQFAFDRSNAGDEVPTVASLDSDVRWCRDALAVEYAAVRAADPSTNADSQRGISVMFQPPMRRVSPGARTYARQSGEKAWRMSKRDRCSPRPRRPLLPRAEDQGLPARRR